MISRQEALELLHSFAPEGHLVQHALASEAILRALAERLGEDEEVWALTGLLHDIDFPQTKADPAKHGLVGAECLEGKIPQESLYAIKAHNDCTNIKPEHKLDFALRCGETVTGLVITAALVRPTRLEGMEVKSLKKKIKDKAFAASVCRDTLRECSHIGLEIDDFLALSIHALQKISKDLGL